MNVFFELARSGLQKQGALTHFSFQSVTMGANLRTATSVWQTVFLLAVLVIMLLQLAVMTATGVLVMTFLVDWYGGWSTLLVQIIAALP